MSDAHSRIEAKIRKLKFLMLIREARSGDVTAIQALDQVYDPLHGESYPDGLESIIDAYMGIIESEIDLDCKLN